MSPLAIAFTPNYFVPAATMLRSLLDASTGDFEVICLVTEEIPERMQEKLVRLGAGRLSFRFIPLKGRLEGIYTDPRYTEAASFRLLLPEILPEYDSLVYIDCDVIVRQDVGKLWRETDLGDNWLVMNLAQMRKEHVSERLLEACRVPYLEFPDQDALNQVCLGRVLQLSPVYNGIRTFFIPKYKPDFVRQYSEELWDEVQRNGTIHYTGGKPWDIFSVRFGDWWRTYECLPDEIKQEWKPSANTLLMWSFYRIRPIGTVVDFFRRIKP